MSRKNLFQIILCRAKRRWTKRRSRGQSFVELALILPVLMLLILGVVEVTVFIGRYLDILDLTREAARFASVRDPFDTVAPRDQDCSTPGLFDFYYDTACIFSPPAGSGNCTDSRFCNGLNPYVVLDPALDDVVVSVYTVSNNQVSHVWPEIGYWALSDHDADTDHNGNWRRDCQGELVRSEPQYTLDSVNASLSGGSPPAKGFVAVEFFYCYDQVLNLPVLNTFIPNPLRIHAFTIMPLPAAQPTPTTTP